MFPIHSRWALIDKIVVVYAENLVFKVLIGLMMLLFVLSCIVTHCSGTSCTATPVRDNTIYG